MPAMLGDLLEYVSLFDTETLSQAIADTRLTDRSVIRSFSTIIKDDEIDRTKVLSWFSGLSLHNKTAVRHAFESKYDDLIEKLNEGTSRKFALDRTSRLLRMCYSGKSVAPEVLQPVIQTVCSHIRTFELIELRPEFCALLSRIPLESRELCAVCGLETLEEDLEEVSEAINRLLADDNIFIDVIASQDDVIQQTNSLVCHGTVLRLLVRTRARLALQTVPGSQESFVAALEFAFENRQRMSPAVFRLISFYISLVCLAPLRSDLLTALRRLSTSSRLVNRDSGYTRFVVEHDTIAAGLFRSSLLITTSQEVGANTEWLASMFHHDDLHALLQLVARLEIDPEVRHTLHLDTFVRIGMAYLKKQDEVLRDAAMGRGKQDAKSKYVYCTRSLCSRPPGAFAHLFLRLFNSLEERELIKGKTQIRTKSWRPADVRRTLRRHAKDFEVVLSNPRIAFLYNLFEGSRDGMITKLERELRNGTFDVVDEHLKFEYIPVKMLAYTLTQKI